MAGFIRSSRLYERTSKKAGSKTDYKNGPEDNFEVSTGYSGRDVDKFARAGLTRQASSHIKSALIEECPVNVECRVVHAVDFPGSHQWYIGQILCAHVDAGYVRDHALLYWPREFRRVGGVIPVENA